MTEAKTEREQGLELAMQLIGASAEQLAATNNTLIDNYRHQAETAEATLDAIREQVHFLLEGAWMPTPAALTRALWPSDDVVDRHRPATGS